MDTDTDFPLEVYIPVISIGPASAMITAEPFVRRLLKIKGPQSSHLASSPEQTQGLRPTKKFSEKELQSQVLTESSYSNQSW